MVFTIGAFPLRDATLTSAAPSHFCEVQAQKVSWKLQFYQRPKNLIKTCKNGEKREKYFVPDWLGEMKDEKIPQSSSPPPSPVIERSEVCGEEKKALKNINVPTERSTQERN